MYRGSDELTLNDEEVRSHILAVENEASLNNAVRRQQTERANPPARSSLSARAHDRDVAEAQAHHLVADTVGELMTNSFVFTSYVEVVSSCCTLEPCPSSVCM